MELANWITILSTVALVILTGIYVWLTHKMLASQSDPCVVISVVNDPDNPTILTLVVRNIGNSIAFNVRINFSKEIPAQAMGIKDPKEVIPLVAGPLVTGIPALEPNGTRIMPWGQFAGLKAALGQEIPIAVVTFRNGNEKYLSIECPLDIGSFENTSAKSSINKQMASELKKIREQLEILNKEK